MARVYILKLGKITGGVPLVAGQTPPAGLTPAQLVVVKAAAEAAEEE